MAYSIIFKSLRSQASDVPYVVNIGGTGGTALKGGASPLVTQEDDSEDMFKPVRTQSGYLRVVDDGKDASGTALPANWWTSLIPETDTSIPINLTKGNDVIWQGFMQAQTFSGELYGGTQEREYPIQCPLSALASKQAPTNKTDMSNFAALLKYILVDQMPSGVEFNNFIFQGGADARTWLLKCFDWHNFIDVTDNGVTSIYTLLDILEDVCQFWGWTCRTWRDSVIFTCTDDSAETKALELNRTTLATLAADTTGTSTAGTDTNDMFSSLSIGNYFASRNNNESTLRGVSKATVSANCNQTKGLIEFAPQSVRDQMENVNHPYVWEQPDPDNALVGLFRTNPAISSFDSQYISGTGSFDRRQIYSDESAGEPSLCDCILINDYDTGSVLARIQTKRDRIFTGGSLRISGTIYKGVELLSDGRHRGLNMRIGIGTDINNAQWFYTSIAVGTWEFSYGWNNTRTNSFFLFESMEIGQVITGTTPGGSGAYYVIDRKYPSIPISGNMFGKVFVEFLGSPTDEHTLIAQNFQIANFKLEYSRDSATIIGERTRTLVKDRQSSRDYTATNVNPCEDEWNADCIFASDNNMEYGYGLLMNPGGSFMSKAQYAGVADSQYPEQHLANRVASYWDGSKRRIDAELQSQATAEGTTIGAISPRHKVTIGGITAGVPVAISHDWRDDVTMLTVIEA